jgi:oxygen-dependent protoporphyrinogen oxidase
LAVDVRETTHEVAVVGAGIAGLSAAWELRGRDVVLLEADHRVGGRIKSVPRGDYWLNFGAHVFSGPDSVVGGLIDAMRVEAVSVPGRLTALCMGGKVVASGRVETYPFRVTMPLAARAALIRVGAKLRAAVAEYQRVGETRGDESAASVRHRVLAHRGDASFADFVGGVPSEVDALFRATINRSTGESEEVSAGCGIGYFALVWSKGGGLSRNIVGGSSLLTETIASRLVDRVVLGAHVDAITREADRVRVRFTAEGQPRELTARFVIIATPAYTTAQVAQDLPAETREALGRIPYGPYAVMAVLTDETRPMAWDQIYALATPGRSFNMMFNHANVLRPRTAERRCGGSLMVYAGADLARRLLDKSDEEIARIFRRDLVDIYPELDSVVRETVIQRWERALPIPFVGRHRLQPALTRDLGNVFLAGDYLGSWYTETAAATGREAALAVLSRLPARSPSPIGADRATAQPRDSSVQR